MYTVIIVLIAIIVFCTIDHIRVDWNSPTPYERAHPFYRIRWCLLRNLLPILLASGALFCVFLAIWVAISSVVCNNQKPAFETEATLVKTEKIVSLAGKPQQYLLHTSTKEAMTLTYVTETDKGYKIRTVKTDNAYVQYDTLKRCAEYYTISFKNSFLKHFFINYFSDETIIYVPKYTIVTDQSIQLRGDK